MFASSIPRCNTFHSAATCNKHRKNYIQYLQLQLITQVTAPPEIHRSTETAPAVLTLSKEFPKLLVLFLRILYGFCGRHS